MAAKALRRLNQAERAQVIEAIDGLPVSGDIKRLRGRIDLYRLRVGERRVLYEVDFAARTVRVQAVAPRGAVYRKR